MKTKRMIILILLFVPILSFAGEIYGTIKVDDGKPLTNQVVQIMQNGKLIASAKTDNNGYFTGNIREISVLGHDILSIMITALGKVQDIIINSVNQTMLPCDQAGPEPGKVLF